jgi:DNA modification methylase
LDPFAGTGTTIMVARALGRHGVGIDLSADYLRLARWRIYQSGHAAKTMRRTWDERQGSLLG